jgi:two-component system chemotaxis response regulator CheY
MTSSKKFNVLIVDDEVKITKIIHQYLNLYSGFNKIVIAENVLQATQKLANQEFDLIISDLNMGKVGGTNLVEYTKKHPKYNKIKYIVVSGFVSKEVTIQLIKGGVRHIIVKPFTARQILETVFKVLKVSKKPEEMANTLILELAEKLQSQKERILEDRKEAISKTLEKYYKQHEKLKDQE